MTEARREWRDDRSDLIARQDDCLVAIEDGLPLPVIALQALPPWRAVLLARVAARAASGYEPLERGTVDQIRAEASAAGGSGHLGSWWER